MHIMIQMIIFEMQDFDFTSYSYFLASETRIKCYTTSVAVRRILQSFSTSPI